MRLAFMGTSQFAVPSLEALASTDHELLAVFSQPDRPSGRGHRLAPSPVKAATVTLGLNLRQPESLNSDSFRHLIDDLQLNLIAVVAYGKIIPPWLIETPAMGVVNLHGSLLPKYRGAAPINWAIADGQTRTGVCTMQIDRGLDTGPVYACRETDIGTNETAPQLSARLAAMGAVLLVKTIEGIEDGTLVPMPQNEEQATHAPRLKKEDGRITWKASARSIHNKIRGFLPWPSVVVSFREITCKLLESRLTEETTERGEPGTISYHQGRLRVLCGDHRWLVIERLQPENRKALSGIEFVNGFQPEDGDRFSDLVL